MTTTFWNTVKWIYRYDIFVIIIIITVTTLRAIIIGHGHGRTVRWPRIFEHARAVYTLARRTPTGRAGTAAVFQGGDEWGGGTVLWYHTVGPPLISTVLVVHFASAVKINKINYTYSMNYKFYILSQ